MCPEINETFYVLPKFKVCSDSLRKGRTIIGINDCERARVREPQLREVI